MRWLFDVPNFRKPPAFPRTVGLGLSKYSLGKPATHARSKNRSRLLEGELGEDIGEEGRECPNNRSRLLDELGNIGEEGRECVG